MVTEEVNASGDGKAYTYDLNGNLLRAADADGNVTEYSYNTLNLVTEINYSGGKKVNCVYNKAGHLVEVADWNGTGTYENDPLGRLTKLTDVKGRITEYAYDPAGNKTGITYPDGTGVSYGYDIAGRLAKVTDSDGAETLYSHDILGRLTGVMYPNGELKVNEYDSLGRVAKTSEGLTDVYIDMPNISAYDPNEIFNADNLHRAYEYSYDATGNLTEERITGIGIGEPTVKSYGYDSAGRLIRAEDTEGVREYAYDPAGNMVSEINAGATTSYFYNELNQLTGKKTGEYEYSFTYDRRGNQISETKNGETMALYEYDETNRMVKGMNADAEESLYTYDGFGNRIEHATFTAESLKRTEYVIDVTSLFNRELMSYSDRGETIRSVYGYGKISETISEGEAPTAESITKRYFHQDRLGSTAYVSDEAGRMLAYTDRDEWGKVRSVTQLQPDIGIIKPEAMSDFTGYSYDAVLDKHFAQARMYDAGTKRFMAEDISKDGFNWYQYCANNPVRFADPTGRVYVDSSLIGDLAAAVTAADRARLISLINNKFAPEARVSGEFINGLISSLGNVSASGRLGIVKGFVSTLEANQKKYEAVKNSSQSNKTETTAQTQQGSGTTGTTGNKNTTEAPLLNKNMITEEVRKNFISQATAGSYQPYKQMFSWGWTILDTFAYGLNKMQNGYNNPNDTETLREYYFKEIYCKNDTNNGTYDFTAMTNSYAMWLENTMGLAEPEALKQQQNWETGQWMMDLVGGASTAVVTFYTAGLVIEAGGAIISVAGPAVAVFVQYLSNAMDRIGGSSGGYTLALADGGNLGAAIDAVSVNTQSLIGAMQMASQAVSNIDPFMLSQLQFAVSNAAGGGQGTVTGGYGELKTGDKTPNGREFTEHGALQANARKYSSSDVDSIIDNWTNKWYQSGGKTVYMKNNSYGYDVVIIDKNGKGIVSVIGGNGNQGVNNTLKTLDDVKNMLNNNGGYSFSPMP